MTTNKADGNAIAPRVDTRWLAWFTRYTAWYLRRNFHRLHLLRLADLDQTDGIPLLVCLNHPAWWDPLLGVYLSRRLFPDREHAAPIAAEGLAKYKLFERLGFFGIEPNTARGAAKFLKIGQAVLSRPCGALWVTAQGDFADVRLPIRLKPGIGYLASRLERFAMLPVAFEYSFWNERYPEAFACIGPPLIEHGRNAESTDWNFLFTLHLQQTVDTLSARVCSRNPAAFEPLLTGNAGVGGVYDLWRACKAKLLGKQWQPEHGSH